MAIVTVGIDLAQLENGTLVDLGAARLLALMALLGLVWCCTLSGT